MYLNLLAIPSTTTTRRSLCFPSSRLSTPATTRNLQQPQSAVSRLSSPSSIHLQRCPGTDLQSFPHGCPPPKVIIWYRRPTTELPSIINSNFAAPHQWDNYTKRNNNDKTTPNGKSTLQSPVCKGVLKNEYDSYNTTRTIDTSAPVSLIRYYSIISPDSNSLY